MFKLVCGLFLLLAISCTHPGVAPETAMSPVAPPFPGTGLVPPQTGMYFGAYASYQDGSAPSLQRAITKVETLAGRKLAWAIVLNEWPGVLTFPKAEANVVHGSGATPFIRILPRSTHYQTNQLDPVIRLDQINQGKYDDQIKQWARDARDIGYPLMAEFGPEANGFWNQWSGVLYPPNGPALYASVYRRIVTLCRGEGANNITWFFHMNGEDNPQSPTNRMAQFYPGDDYIDWIGVSVLGAQQVTDYWDKFIDVMDRGYNEIQAVSSTKPIALVETAVVEDPKDTTRKAKWFHAAFSELESGRWPRLKAYSYWNEPGWETNNNDLRFNSSANALAAFQTGVANSFFISSLTWVLPPQPHASMSVGSVH